MQQEIITRFQTRQAHVAVTFSTLSSLISSLTRHWLLSVIVLIGLTYCYASSPLYGADPTPTPNVSTVPPLSDIVTPTATATPIIMVATAVASPPVFLDNETKANESTTVRLHEGTEIVTTTDALPMLGRNDIAVSSEQTKGIVTAVQLNVRKGPFVDSPIIDTLMAGTQVELFGRTAASDWLYICCSAVYQQFGWIASQFVHLDTPDNYLFLPVLTDAGKLLAVAMVSENVGIPTLQVTVRDAPVNVWQGISATGLCRV